ncbi:MAG: Dipeptide transport system permease protein DppB [candidate division BRC1 bacterium ADurb.BinA364]|nr:MAG: Dipeptide transport system permease protein DppB [candidate division BRC1 bacterium ADurb.BinA364]
MILKHAVRNGLLPILTLLAGLLPAVLGGSVIIEYIFGIPGMGQWTIDSIYQRDYNVIMAVQLISTILVLLGILLSDLSYALVDPRITYK